MTGALAGVTLPAGVTLYIGGKTYSGEIPEAVCPAHLKPKPESKSKSAKND